VICKLLYVDHKVNAKMLKMRECSNCGKMMRLKHIGVQQIFFTLSQLVCVYVHRIITALFRIFESYIFLQLQQHDCAQCGCCCSEKKNSTAKSSH